MTDKLLEINGMNVLLLDNYIENDILPDQDLADIWIVNNINEGLVKKFLRKKIRSKDINIYLKPIFLQKELKKFYFNKNNNLKYLSDGYIKSLDFIDKLPFIEIVFSYISKYQHERNFNEVKEKEFLFKRFFDHYYTRAKKIKPILNHKSLTGYCYPFIEAYFRNTKDAFVISRNMLNEAFYEGWIRRNYIDTSHLCSKCNSGFLNYREVCPKCNDHNLTAENIIHHFRCAYVGVERDFVYNNKLICPKCSSELKNIGVDYDKPGNIFTCKNKKCNNEFQDAPIGVFCVDCSTKQNPSDLIVRKIYEYEITTLGLKVGLSIKNK